MFVAIYTVEIVLQLLAIANNTELNIDSPFYEFQIFVALGTFVVAVGIILMLIIHVLLVLFSKGKRAFFFDQVAELEATKK